MLRHRGTTKPRAVRSSWLDWLRISPGQDHRRSRQACDGPYRRSGAAAGARAGPRRHIDSRIVGLTEPVLAGQGAGCAVDEADPFITSASRSDPLILRHDLSV